MERLSHETSVKRMFRVAAMTEAKVSSLEHPSEALGLDVRVRQGVYEEKPGPQLETSIVIQVSGGEKNAMI